MNERDKSGFLKDT